MKTPATSMLRHIYGRNLAKLQGLMFKKPHTNGDRTMMAALRHILDSMDKRYSGLEVQA